MLAGPRNAKLLPASFLIGGIFLVNVDNFSRSISSMEIPLGITTSFNWSSFFHLHFNKNFEKRLIMIALNDLTCGYKNKIILKNISCTMELGSLTCLLGKNGAGKTTLLKTMLGLIPHIKGQITYDGKTKKEFSDKEFSKMISYVPQIHQTPFQYKVIDVVEMGQFIHTESIWGIPQKKKQGNSNDVFRIIRYFRTFGTKIYRIKWR